MAARFNAWQGFIQALLYGVQFDADPSGDESVERSIRMVVEGDTSATVDDYLDAIHTALNETTDLSQLLPQPHADAIVRTFLSAVAMRLRARKRTTVVVP